MNRDELKKYFIPVGERVSGAVDTINKALSILRIDVEQYFDVLAADSALELLNPDEPDELYLQNFKFSLFGAFKKLLSEEYLIGSSVSLIREEVSFEHEAFFKAAEKVPTDVLRHFAKLNMWMYFSVLSEENERVLATMLATCGDKLTDKIYEEWQTGGRLAFIYGGDNMLQHCDPCYLPIAKVEQSDIGKVVYLCSMVNLEILSGDEKAKKIAELIRERKILLDVYVQELCELAGTAIPLSYGDSEEERMEWAAVNAANKLGVSIV